MTSSDKVHFCLKMAHIAEYKLFYGINEINVSILKNKDSKILMKMAYLVNFVVKK